MNDVSTSAPEVLRGMRVEGAPLRLGRAAANAGSVPAAQALVEEAAEERALREARAHAMRQAHDEGLRAGRAEGLREGRAQAAEEVRAAVDRAVAEAEAHARAELECLQRIAQHAQVAVADALWAAQDEIVAVCFETLCRIVAASAMQPQVVKAQVAQLLAQHGVPGIVLHVHPQDARLFQDVATPGTPLAVLADSEVTLGGCILKTGAGALDARLESMLGACKSALLEARANAVRGDPCGEEAA